MKTWDVSFDVFFPVNLQCKINIHFLLNVLRRCVVFSSDVSVL